ncbi:MAG: hypothetical protein EB165_04095 [Euryarchaeota archaeon]|nr:hypothetical protein [Euryarchaeota archaeon]NDB93811.1 hypothetical protein [Euryarchaeota archaeon]
MKRQKIDVPDLHFRALQKFVKQGDTLLKARVYHMRNVGSYDNEHVLNTLLDLMERVQALGERKGKDGPRFENERDQARKFLEAAYLQAQESPYYQTFSAPERKHIEAGVYFNSLEGDSSLSKKLAGRVSDGMTSPLPSLDASDSAMTFDTEKEVKA